MYLCVFVQREELLYDAVSLWPQTQTECIGAPWKLSSRIFLHWKMLIH